MKALEMSMFDFLQLAPKAFLTLDTHLAWNKGPWEAVYGKVFSPLFPYPLALKDTFVNPYSESDLKQLREDDPAEYAARKQEIAEREKALTNLLNEAIKTTQESQVMQSEEYQRQYAEYFHREQQRTLEMIPNWKTVENDVAKYASDVLGFTAQEIGQIADSRLLKAFYNSMLFEKGQEGAKTKLVRKVPKVMKGGNRPSKNQTAIEQQLKAQKRLKETGDWRDAVAALKSRR